MSDKEMNQGGLDALKAGPIAGLRARSTLILDTGLHVCVTVMRRAECVALSRLEIGRRGQS